MTGSKERGEGLVLISPPAGPGSLGRCLLQLSPFSIALQAVTGGHFRDIIDPKGGNHGHYLYFIGGQTVSGEVPWLSWPCLSPVLKITTCPRVLSQTIKSHKIFQEERNPLLNKPLKKKKIKSPLCRTTVLGNSH